MTKLIEDNIVVALMNYLATRPYSEVSAIMPILANLPEEKKKDATTDIN